jgi:hypothetical protein
VAAAPAPTYNPPRQPAPKATGDPLEVELVYNLTACGTCSYFWPASPAAQPYGPYPTFDISMNPPPPKDPDAATKSFKWVDAVTAEPAFPLPEVLDGCRKAPIMTIGINPNLTAFAPGQTGSAWCYPNFSDDATADLYEKYAYYYRYRSVFQERFDLTWIEQFIQSEQRIVAPKAGYVVSADRKTDSPSFDLVVHYDGDQADTRIPLTHDPGTPRWVVLYDTYGATSKFAAGATLAGRLDVPAGQKVQVYRQQVGYYEQFVPVLEAFQQTVRADGHPNATLQMGEDVCQLDMVASASPHWNPGFLGGSTAAENTVVDNCVSKNAYAVKQLVQTKPAMLYLVGESTYDMFRDAFGALLVRDVPLDAKPADGPYTLLRETTDPAHPCNLVFKTTIDKLPYSLTTRIVVTPHFSYSSNFIPQIRISPADWAALQANDPDCVKALSDPPSLVCQPPQTQGGYVSYAAVALNGDANKQLAALCSAFPNSAAVLHAGFYDPHALMGSVLDELYKAGTISYGPIPGGNDDALGRTEGSCQFCVNDHWKFAGECRYMKTTEQAPPVGYLEQVAGQLVAAGVPGKHSPAK